jgi:predicted  nucleic acid-binding Zn-ribbon protein
VAGWNGCDTLSGGADEAVPPENIMSAVIATGTLRTLHRMHRQLEDLRGRLAAGPRRIAALAAAIAAASTRREAALDAVKQARLAADQKQLQLRSAEVKIRDLEGKLNACKTNREYQTLGDQIAADKMATSVLEDEILDALEAIDARKLVIPEAEAAITAARQQLAQEESRVQTEAGELEGEVARIQGELQALERELADDVRERYDRVVKQKGADGMAAVDGQDCGGCHQHITSNMLSELLIGRIVMCRSCGRLLYTPTTVERA